MVIAPRITTRLKERREQAGLSQVALAEQIGVSRQALIAIEAGRQVPATSLSLQLARALGCRVEDLFELAPSSALAAVVAPAAPGQGGSHLLPGSRVAIGRIGDRWVAHGIWGDTRVAADGILGSAGQQGSMASFDPLVDPAELERNVLVAGCAPLLGIVAARAGMRYRDARITWLAANSSRALDWLDCGLVHVAGLHLLDRRSKAGNLAALRKRFAARRMLIVNLTRWRQGFVVAKGNPMGIREGADLLRTDIRFAGREQGAGARQLARKLLAGAGAKPSSLPRGPMAAGHEAVAQLVRCGAADVGIAIESVAIAAGLDFVPLSEERFDLVVPAERAAEAPVSRLVESLSEAAFRIEAARLPGYDSSISGHVTALDDD